jgi:hypothetical protein
MHDHEFKLDMDGQVTCSICGAMGDDMPNPEPTTGYGYDELKDFDMGYRDIRKNRITPFLGRSR